MYTNDEQYTFDNFIVSKSNQLAYEVLRKESLSSEIVYSPLLYIYGDTVVGKTHLLKAFANNVSEWSNEVLYTTLESFMNEFTENIESQTMDRFRSKYRECDLLIVDNMQDIWGKEQIQEEFYYTITDLIAAGKKVVLAGTLSPYRQEGLISDLAYYLSGAMVIKIDRPDDDMKQLLAKDSER